MEFATDIMTHMGPPAIAVATTFAPAAFNEQGDYSNAAEELFRKIGAEMAPDDAPPMPPPK